MVKPYELKRGQSVVVKLSSITATALTGEKKIHAQVFGADEQHLSFSKLCLPGVIGFSS